MDLSAFYIIFTCLAPMNVSSDVCHCPILSGLLKNHASGEISKIAMIGLSMDYPRLVRIIFLT